MTVVPVNSAVDTNPNPDCIRIQWGPWIRIRIRNLDPDPGGENDSQT
jgi:hypothetical protein